MSGGTLHVSQQQRGVCAPVLLSGTSSTTFLWRPPGLPTLRQLLLHSGLMTRCSRRYVISCACVAALVICPRVFALCVPSESRRSPGMTMHNVQLYLDGIVTVVDASHVLAQLADPRPAGSTRS